MKSIIQFVLINIFNTTNVFLKILEIHGDVNYSTNKLGKSERKAVK